jgi:DUF1680 family protein
MSHKAAGYVSRRALLLGTAPVALGVAGAGQPVFAQTQSEVPTPPKLESFPLEAVRLLPSPYYSAMQANLSYLHRLEPDRLLHNFRAQAGLPPKGAVYGGWESESIAGHTLGHYLSACSHMHAQTGDEECRRRVEYIVGELILCQARYADGYVGGLWRKKDGRIDPGRVVFEEVRAGRIDATPFSLNGAWSPLYTIHKLFAGLLDADRYCHAKRALAVAEKLAGYFSQVFAPLNHQQVQEVLVCEYGGLNESFAELYARTGRTRWLRLAETIYDDKVLDPLTRRRDDLAYKHANTNIPKLVGLARLYEISREPDYGVASAFFWQDVVGRYSYVIGGNGDRDYFQAPMTISTHITDQTCETCSSYNMLKLTRHLYARAPRADYFDFFERTHLNHILAQQNPQTGMFAYMTPLMAGSYRHYSTPFDDFWCCVGTGMESHAKHGESIYWRKANNLYVNLYIPSTLAWMAQRTRIQLTTGYPFADDVEIQFLESQAPDALTLWLRVPVWCTSPKLKINGRAYSVKMADGYVRLTRHWQVGDVISLELPRSLRLEPTADDPNTLTMLLGPLVLSADLGPAAKPWHGQTPAFVAEDVLAKVSEEADGRFRAVAINHTEPLQISAFAFQHERRNAVYFRRYSPWNWQKEQEERAAERLQQRALDARSSDIIHLGDATSERAHSLLSQDSYAVVYRRRTGRDARAGGFMQFVLKAAPGPLSLELTYWGEERDRHFKIFVDSLLIAQQRLSGAHPGRFFTCDYPIAPQLTAERASITVRIEPFARMRAGPVFGARLVRRLG